MDAGTLIRTIVGHLLIAAGLLISVSCGLCTGYFGIMSIGELFQSGPRTIMDYAPLLALGALATAIGIGMVLGGNRLRKGKSPPPSP